MEKKFTQGQWKPAIISGICMGVEVELQPGYTQMIFNTILPDTDKQYAKEKAEILANVQLTCASKDLLEALEDMLSIAIYANEFDPELMADERISIARKAISKALNIK